MPFLFQSLRLADTRELLELTIANQRELMFQFSKCKICMCRIVAGTED